MVRSIFSKEIEARKLQGYLARDWEQVSPVDGNIVKVRKELEKWEKFEYSMREFFCKAGFDDSIASDEFWFDDLGYQVDVCGGIGTHFIIMDCTSKQEEGFKSLKEKIKDNHYKMKKLKRGVKTHYKGKYKKTHFVICTEDIDQSQEDIKDAEDHGIFLIDKSRILQWKDLVRVIGPSIRFQILETFAGAKIPIEGGPKELRYNALRIAVCRSNGGKKRYVYVFAMDPETLLKAAVVYRLKYQDPRGYQRDLKVKKLQSVNEYLSDFAKFFPSSILVAFDEDERYKIKWKGSGQNPRSPIQSGHVSIPKFHSIAEVIDGQHRLYGYEDFTSECQFEGVLRRRRVADRLIVVGIPDPAANERPELYLSINSTQTKISTRDIWALMGETRRTSKMGYISNIIRALNEMSYGVFRDEIEIPRITRGHRRINIANFGKGLSDRHIVDREDKNLYWNLWFGERRKGEYPDEPDENTLRKLDLYYRCVKNCHKDDWNSRDSFLRSNNGVNVMLRVLVEILIFYDDKPITKGRVNDLLKPVLKKYIDEKGAKELLEDSSEVGREKIAREIMKRIHTTKKGFAVEYLKKRKMRRK